jgi:predicted RNase H-like HicB family nuclease
MQHPLKMVYRRGKRHWIGKLVECPHIMTQGDTLEELEEHLKDAFRERVLEAVPAGFKMKEITV